MVPYVGVIHSCLEGSSPSIECSFGRLCIAVNTKSARNKVRSTTVAGTVGLFTLMMSLLGARLSSAYKNNPFFVPGTHTPIRPVRALSRAERERAYRREV